MKGLGSNIMLVIPGGITAGGVRLGAQTGQGLTEEDALAIAGELRNLDHLHAGRLCEWLGHHHRHSQ